MHILHTLLLHVSTSLELFEHSEHQQQQMTLKIIKLHSMIGEQI